MHMHTIRCMMIGEETPEAEVEGKRSIIGRIKREMRLWLIVDDGHKAIGQERRHFRIWKDTLEDGEGDI